MNAVDPETGTAGVAFERDKSNCGNGLPRQQTSVDQGLRPDRRRWRGEPESVCGVVRAQRAEDPTLSIMALLDRLQHTHGVRLHRRTVERIVGGGPRKKNAAER